MFDNVFMHLGPLGSAIALALPLLGVMAIIAAETARLAKRA